MVVVEKILQHNGCCRMKINSFTKLIRYYSSYDIMVVVEQMTALGVAKMHLLSPHHLETRLVRHITLSMYSTQLATSSPFSST